MSTHLPMVWAMWLALAIVLVVLAATGLAAHGQRRWAASTQRLFDELAASQRPASGARYDARELDGLPAPVARYFRAVLKDGQRIVTSATIELAGSLDLAPTGGRWKPTTSVQRVVTSRPGFVWSAQIRVAPGVAVLVQDAYVAGTGILKASVMGLHTLAEQRDTGELARGELMRYFAEAAWYPTALLPSQGVQWAAVDDHSANATLTDGAIGVTMRVAFDRLGMIESARFEARGAMVGDKVVPTPWEGRWSDHQERNGMQVPMACEAAWLHPEGRTPYFRGNVTALNHGFTP